MASWEPAQLPPAWHRSTTQLQVWLSNQLLLMVHKQELTEVTYSCAWGNHKSYLMSFSCCA